MADKLNSIPKLVFSKTLQSAPWGKWPAAKIESGDVVKAVTEMKNQPGEDMVLWGSISLSQHLMRANLIDEYHLRIVPVLLGGGIPLFSNAGEGMLELMETRAYPSGLLLVKYKRK